MITVIETQLIQFWVLPFACVQMATVSYQSLTNKTTSNGQKQNNKKPTLKSVCLFIWRPLFFFFISVSKVSDSEHLVARWQESKSSCKKSTELPWPLRFGSEISKSLLSTQDRSGWHQTPQRSLGPRYHPHSCHINSHSSRLWKEVACIWSLRLCNLQLALERET